MLYGKSLMMKEREDFNISMKDKVNKLEKDLTLKTSELSKYKEDF